MFRFARHKMFVVIVFSINYGINVKFLCGDNSTEYGYEAFMLEKLVFMEKLENLYSYFHMVITCSSAKSESMSDISEEILKYFSELIKPLATNANLKEIFDKMKEEVISKFE